MRNFILTAISGTLLTGAALAAAPAIIQPGVWRTQDGTTTVRIADCKGTSDQCATVIEERLAPGEPSQLGKTLVRDIRPGSKKGWTGKYVADNQPLAAKISQAGPNTMKFKICAFAFLCDTIILARLSD